MDYFSFCSHLCDSCTFNNYDMYLPEDRHKKVSLTYALHKKRCNEYLNFLIILADKNYVKGCMGKSYFDYIDPDEFPGNLVILNKNELVQYPEYIIDGPVTLRKLYIQLPKEQLYVDASKYEERLLNSITAEFLRVVSTLKPLKIKLKIYNQNNSEVKFNLNTTATFNNVEVGSAFNNEQTNNSNSKKEWLLTFAENKHKIDMRCFLDNTSFYYLPKRSDWNDIIRSRVKLGMNTAHHVYEHTIENGIDAAFLSKMKMLNIECKYKKYRYENLIFEYDIEYYHVTI